MNGSPGGPRAASEVEQEVVTSLDAQRSKRLFLGQIISRPPQVSERSWASFAKGVLPRDLRTQRQNQNKEWGVPAQQILSQGSGWWNDRPRWGRSTGEQGRLRGKQGLRGAVELATHRRTSSDERDQPFDHPPGTHDIRRRAN